MKRKRTVLAAIGGAIIVTSVACFTLASPDFGRVDAPKIFAAVQSYANDLQAHGKALPATVTLRGLMARGLLKPEDVSGFAGMDVAISLDPSQSDAQDVWMRVRMQDGSQVVALADGSVQAVSRFAVLLDGFPVK